MAAMGRLPLACRIHVAGHAPFAWGATAEKALENARVLEEVARMALLTRSLNPSAERLPDYVLDKHFLRKHGKDAYYGQGKGHGSK